VGHTGGTPEGKRKALAEFAAQFTRNPLAELGAQTARDQQAFADLAAQMARPLIDPALLRPLVVIDHTNVPRPPVIDHAGIAHRSIPALREIVPLAEQLDGAVSRWPRPPEV
jgi:hypothetical protein